ncbi:hypothetical protein N7G274_003347 [Stereocaulon virgatum]|uniref:Uncharacterized protein n=1 Tax=Stereocaulon virgatum TaxID=373712 RepID=A0ABR4ADD2_9LECA
MPHAFFRKALAEATSSHRACQINIVKLLELGEGNEFVSRAFTLLYDFDQFRITNDTQGKDLPSQTRLNIIQDSLPLAARISSLPANPPSLRRTEAIILSRRSYTTWWMWSSSIGVPF